jgi:thiamine biosynthesis protein ThiS
VIELIINGDIHHCKENALLTELLSELKLAGKKVAIELNKEIVPRSTYENVTLKEGDKLEIVHFIGGGKK